MPITLMLHGKHQAPNRPQVHYEPFGPWLVPWQFGDAAAEYETLQRRTGLLDYSTQALIECRGADRISFLHRLLTNDIKQLAPGTGCRAALLTETGKFVAELVVLAGTDATWLLCDLSVADQIVQTLEKYHITEDLTFTNTERAKTLLSLEGPESLALIRRLANSPALLSGPLTHATASISNIPVHLIRYSMLQSGIWCLVEAPSAEPLWRSLISSGAPPVGWDAFNTARIEAGVPLFSIDMDHTNLLPETGLESALCSETKGCYMGQEIIARMATYGSANKKLMGLLIDGDAVPQAKDRIMRNDEEAGWITSGAMSRALGRPIGMGYVKRGAYEDGTTVRMARGDRALPATVVTLASISRTRAGS